MVLAMNGAEFDFEGFGSFGEFGAASQPIVDLQTALVSLGKGIGDNTLSKIVVDGVIGPKTVAATNRALTVHLGAGQAPANLRTGSLSQAVIVSQADAIATLINTETRRRGFTAAAPKKAAAAKAKPKASAPATYTAPNTSSYVPAAGQATAMTPVYHVPSASASAGGTDMSAVIKWSAIGFGIVALLGVGYYVLSKKPSPRAMTATG